MYTDVSALFNVARWCNWKCVLIEWWNSLDESEEEQKPVAKKAPAKKPQVKKPAKEESDEEGKLPFVLWIVGTNDEQFWDLILIILDDLFSDVP